MSTQSAGSVVVVTGANEGIGYGMAAALVADGYRVAALDVSVDRLETLREGAPDRVLVHRCDVTSDADVEAAIGRTLDQWGRIDVLVNNAAVFTFAPFTEGTPADERRAFEVNYFGCVRTIRTVLPHMLTRNAGIIHNVSSGAGLVGHPGLSGYAATKGAIEALTRSLRLELRHTNVACTVMHPALSNTRSAATIGYPQSFLRDPADVGRGLASRIESRGPVVYSDWTTRVGLALSRRLPLLVRRGTARFVERPEQTAEGRAG